MELLYEGLAIGLVRIIGTGKHYAGSKMMDMLDENKIQTNNLDAAAAIFRKIYETFNGRDVESTLFWMHKDVEWANGMEGKVDYGKDAVREYWTRQWNMIDPNVDPVDINLESDGRLKITVHQVVHDTTGKLLADLTVYHLYTVEDGFVKRMEIQQV